mmetsp:Transcript_29973/g.63787  ORF Transcript_29973/g.63787 Transcript_29973/m.63787 type:complete len:279 (+) Transcript_29973:1330-2166(+)
MDRSARPSRRLQKASSVMRSPPPANSEKRASRVMPLVCTSVRRTAVALAVFASTMVEMALRTASMVLLHTRVVESALDCILIKSFLPSSIGPLGIFGSLPSASLTHAFTSVTLSLMVVTSFSPSSRTETGVAKASISAPFKEVRGVATSSSCLAAASMASTFSATGAVMACASFRSRASMCAFFSANSFLAKSFFACTAFFLSPSTVVDADATFGRSFESSARASARGPVDPGPLSSAAFELRKLETLLTPLRVSSRVLSIWAVKVVKGEIASKYLVP